MKSNKIRNVAILLGIGFSIIILGFVTFMTLKNTRDLRLILEDSIKAELVSTSIAARSILDVERFDSYNSLEDIKNDFEAYSQTLEELRYMKRQFGVTYIYALKLINGEYYFIFDTDEEDDTLFTRYFDDEEDSDIPEVFKNAFLGRESAGIMNVVDEWGSFNTGAVPIFIDGKVVGIICTDIEDTFVQNSNSASLSNAIALVATLSVTMAAMIVLISLLLRHVQTIQNTLYRMANYDVLTGLPNRQYLLTYLAEIAEISLKKQAAFALLLIDIDNFKQVNDNAGHDAGDELLRHIATYLDSIHENSKSFRPPAGVLNVSARIGGDEFVQIIQGISTEDEAQMAAKKVLDNFGSQTLDRYIEKYKIGLSVGVALFPFHTENFNVLIKYADLAMYHAKRSGKNMYRIYNEEMVQLDADAESPDDSKKSADRRKYRN